MTVHQCVTSDARAVSAQLSPQAISSLRLPLPTRQQRPPGMVKTAILPSVHLAPRQPLVAAR